MDKKHSLYQTPARTALVPHWDAERENTQLRILNKLIDIDSTMKQLLKIEKKRTETEGFV